MMRINLLPDSYRTAQLARRHHRRHAAWCVLLIAAGICWWQAATLQAGRISLLADQEEGRLRAEQEQAHVLAGMNDRRRAAHAVLGLEADLEVPIHTGLIVAALSRALPPNVALTRLSVEMTPVRVQAASAPVSGARPAPAGARPAEEKPIRIELEGLAVNEQDLARCISALADHRLFTNVKLAKSRQAVGDGTPRFGFTITADIPANRKYIVSKEATAHAI